MGTSRDAIVERRTSNDGAGASDSCGNTSSVTPCRTVVLGPVFAGNGTVLAGGSSLASSGAMGPSSLTVPADRSTAWRTCASPTVCRSARFGPSPDNVDRSESSASAMCGAAHAEQAVAAAGLSLPQCSQRQVTPGSEGFMG